ILMMIGIYGLFIEFTSPGFGVPGVAGAIALMLGLYAFQMLPVNWAGVALLGLGALLLIAEVFLPSFGVLGIGGIIAIVLGGLFLMDTELPSFDVSLPFVLGLALATAAVVLGTGAFALRSRRRPIVAGREDMVGSTGVVSVADAEEIWVHIKGERWRARSSAPLQRGQNVRVVGVSDLILDVEPVTRS
ncbi:MAG: hypothetical protein NZM12_02000, partial [Steroidobacteraceae bacterium]|nr:hypothetical protein [Steroidobacteraceae bacterium]